jgi:hypothetical protein
VKVTWNRVIVERRIIPNPVLNVYQFALRATR